MPDDERALSPIAQVIRDVPGIALASIGLGCTLLAIEGDRLSTIRTVSVGTDFNTAASILALAVLVGLALLYRKCGRPARIPTAGVIALGALMSASMFVVLQQGAWQETPAISFLGYTMFNVGEGLLLFVWVKTLFPYGARANAVVVALATIVLAAMNCLIAFLKVDAAYTAVSMLPIISVVLLCYFREYARSRSGAETEAEGGSASGNVPDQSLLVPSDRTKSGRRLFAATLMLSLACYAVVFGQIHYQWVGLQDGGTVSLIIQLGTAMGTACGGVAILALVQCFWTRRSLDFYKLFLIPTVLLAL